MTDSAAEGSGAATATPEALGPPLPIFDGHNDTLLRLHRQGQSAFRAFLTAEEPRPAGPGGPGGSDEGEGRDVPSGDSGARGHLDLPRARAGGLVGGFFAVFVPPEVQPRTPEEAGFRRTEDGYEMPLPGPLPLAYAQRSAMAMMATLFRIEDASNGQVRVARTKDDLQRCLQQGRLAAVLHFEGADAIDPELDALEVFYRAGLRSLGPVWSRANAFGSGVPFAFPHSPDIGGGLTDAGRALVQACHRLGIVVDLSHLNERGFWDVAALAGPAGAPLVATHSGAHALCPVSRNVTDRQLEAIRDSGGMVGVVFEVSMLRADGALESDTPLEEIVRHVAYLVERLGIEGVGFGSDFDGATIPRALGDASGLPRVVDALRRHGFDEASLHQLTHQNWLRLLQRVWRD
ncbi:MAG TPA: dipeptidase [Chloroflexota bacterium]|nr:dipeptidase [Chloroflexota bacterium]